MTKDKRNSPDFSELRRRAEAQLAAKPREFGQSSDNTEKVLHELRVCQIELELQNEELRSALEQLEESRANYSDLYDFAPVGYLTLDEKGFIRKANLTASRQIGIARSNLIGTPFSIYLSRSDGDRLRLHLDKGFRSMERQACEVGLRPKGGGDLHALLDSIFVQDVHGKVSCRTSVIDITERKQAEAALREANATLEQRVVERTTALAAARKEAINEKNRLEAVMEALPIGVAITDSGGGNIQSNAAYEQAWGGPRPPADSVDDYAAYKAWWLDTGRAVAPEEWASAIAVQRGEAVLDQLLEIERFDGSRIFVINSASPVRDAQGNVIGSAVAIQDITRLRKTEQALRESEERFRLFMDNSPTVAWMKDEQGRYLYFNKTAENRVGVRFADWLGKTDFDFWPRETAEEFRRNDQTVRATGHAIEFTEEMVNPDGSLCYWLSLKFPFRDLSGRLYVAGIGLDITERKRAEEALGESEARFKLLSETAGRLLASENPQGIVTELCRQVMEHLGCHTFFNFLADEPTGKLHLNAWGGIPEEEARKIEWLDYGMAVCGCAARDGTRIVAEDIFNTPDLRTELVKSYGIQAYACHPLMVEGRVIGTLSFGTKTRTGFSLQELEVMRTVADQVATALERIRLIEELQRSRDELEMRVQERTGELLRANEVLQEQANLLDLAHDAILVRDLHDRVVYWNRGAEKTYGWSQDEARGKVADDLLQTRFPGPLQEIRAQLMEAGEWEGELHHITHNGSLIIVESRQALQRNLDGEPTGILEINHDITKRKETEERLRHLAAIVESSDDAIISKTLEGHILSWNKASERIYGYTFEEVVGQPVSMLVPQDRTDELPELLAKLKNGESLAHYETVRVRKDGTSIPVSLAISPVKDAEARIVGISTIARDITAHKQAEEQLRQALQYSRSLIEASLDPLVTISPEGKITDINEATVKVTGVPREGLIGSDFSTYFTEPEKATEGYLRVFEKGFVTNYPLTIRHRNGNLVEVLYNASVYKDTRGKVLGVFAAARDITARKRAEGKIARAHAMLETVFEGISDPLLMVDKECRIRMLNEVACKYFNIANREGAIAKTCSEVTLGRCGLCDICQICSAIRGGKKATFERKGVFAPERIEQITVYPVDEATSTDSGAIVRISDITQAKVLERQLVQNEKLAALGLLVSGIAHEINNPNTFISFNIPILRDYLQELMPIIDGFAEQHPNLELCSMKYQEFREDLFKLVANMEHGSSRINAIVSDLKRFVRKRDKIQPRCIDLREVIEKAVNICHAEIRKKVKSFEVQISEEVPLILTDPEVVEQVLVNLLINAVQAADKDDSWIKLGVECGRSRERYCVIEVVDNGCGMDGIIRAKIFDPFFTTKAASSGTGLGLPVCYTLVESLGGKIEVESDPGQGSTFRIVLPEMTHRDKESEELVQ